MTHLADYPEFLELVRYRRSIRFIDPDSDVSEEDIEKVLEAARWAPSAGNSQPWEFVVIRDDETREQIATYYAKQMAEKKEMQQAVWGRTSPQAAHIGYSGFRKAPVYLLTICDTRVKYAFPVRTRLDKGEQHLISSMGMAGALMHLAIASLGLGSQWISDVGSPYLATMVRALLDIPDYFEIYDMTGIGRPAHAMPTSPPRRPLEEMVHRERYDRSKERDAAAVEEFLMTYTRLNWAETRSREEFG